MTVTTPGPARLDASCLRRACTLAGLSFTTTDELADLGELPGQGRAIDAIRFGVAMTHDGYNLFVLGPPGSGRGTAVRQLLGAAEAGLPAFLQALAPYELAACVVAEAHAATLRQRFPAFGSGRDYLLVSVE